MATTNDLLNHSKTKELLHKYGQQTVQEMKNRLKGFGKIATGNLSKSISYKVREDKKQINLVWLMLDYAQYVDRGRKPGRFPPVKAISDWCRIKGIPQSAVYPISRKIAEKGIKPTNFLTTTLSRRAGKFQQDLAKAAASDVEERIIRLSRELK